LGEEASQQAVASSATVVTPAVSASMETASFNADLGPIVIRCAISIAAWVDGLAKIVRSMLDKLPPVQSRKWRAAALADKDGIDVDGSFGNQCVDLINNDAETLFPSVPRQGYLRPRNDVTG
jgi:hypothetical protein